MQKLKKKNKDLLAENESLKKKLEQERMLSDNLQFIIDEQSDYIKELEKWANMEPERLREAIKTVLDAKKKWLESPLRTEIPFICDNALCERRMM